MKNIKLDFSILKMKEIFIFLVLLVSQASYSQNIALNKKYSVSASPNYKLTAADIKSTSLTDGVYTKGTKSIWRYPSTVGWQNKERVQIIIDLEGVWPVEKIAFNSVQETAKGIRYPSNIFVFLSSDGKDFTYSGNIMSKQYESSPGYKTQKFTSDNINTNARFVLLEIESTGPYVFCDEIEVIKSNKRIVSRVIGPIYKKDEIRQAVDSLDGISSYKESLVTRSREIRNSISGKQIETELNNFETRIIKSGNDFTELSAIDEGLYKLHALSLKRKFKVPFFVEKVSPWGNLPPFRVPNPTDLNYTFEILEGNVQYGAFVVTNSSPDTKQLSIRLLNSDTVNSLDLFKMAFITSQNPFLQTPDALIPIEGIVEVEPGVSQPFLFKLTGKRVGKGKSTLAVSMGNFKKNIDINIEVKTGQQPPNDDLNAINWAYLNYPLLTARRVEAATDLQKHHINTIVIPPYYIPTLGNNDFSKIVDYLSHFDDIKNILLYANYNSSANLEPRKGIKFMSDAWKSDFKVWYATMLTMITKLGYSADNIYLYPFDEVKGGNISKLESFIGWAKESVPDFHVYATINNAESLKKIAPHIDVDIAQISERYKTVPKKKKGQYWLYSSGSSSSSPYGYYRLMAWRAYSRGFTGIGFWNYADVGSQKENLIMSPIRSSQKNYAVIYTNQKDNSILSSRRWEAFKLGIEDYRLLKIYEKKHGIEQAKKLANRVLSEVDNFNLADEARNVIFDSL